MTDVSGAWDRPESSVLWQKKSNWSQALLQNYSVWPSNHFSIRKGTTEAHNVIKKENFQNIKLEIKWNLYFKLKQFPLPHPPIFFLSIKSLGASISECICTQRILHLWECSAVAQQGRTGPKQLGWSTREANREMLALLSLFSSPFSSTFD